MAALGSGNVQIDTYGELKTLIRAITMKQKGLKIKGIIIDTIADELIGKLPGGPTAKSALDFIKAAFGKPDSVKTNTWLDRLDVDDQLSAIVDDTIENRFLQDISKRIEGQSDNSPLRQDFNMNTELVDFLKKNYKGRTVVGPQNEIKKMKRSQLRELVREMVGGYEPDGQGNLVRHNDKFNSTKLSDILMRVTKVPVNKDDIDKIYSKEEVVDYIRNHSPVKYYKIGVSQGTSQQATSIEDAITIVDQSPIKQFKLSTYGQVIQFSAPFNQKNADLVRSMGPLD